MFTFLTYLSCNLPPYSLPSSHSADHFVFEHMHAALFCFRVFEFLDFFQSETLFLQIIPWLFLFSTLGMQLNYYLLGEIVLTHPI